MPLVHSSSESALRTNIATEIRAGRPQAQAVAIGLSTGRRAWRRSHPKGPFPHHLRRTGGYRASRSNRAGIVKVGKRVSHLVVVRDDGGSLHGRMHGTMLRPGDVRVGEANSYVAAEKIARSIAREQRRDVAVYDIRHQRWSFIPGPYVNRAIQSVGDPEPETKAYHAAMLDVTRDINKDALVRNTPFKASQIDKVYEVVIFTLDERVHLASLTPSTYYETVYFIIKGKEDLPDDEEVRGKWNEMEDELLRVSESGSYMNYADAKRIVDDKKRPKWMRPKNIGDFESMDEAREQAQANYPF